MDERPGTQRPGDPLIAEEARRLQADGRRPIQRRGFGSGPATLAMAVLVIVWLVLCGVVVDMSVTIATAESGGEVLWLAPPVYLVLSAVGTGLAVDIRSRVVGRGPSASRIVASVVFGVMWGTVVGTLLVFMLAGLFSDLIVGDLTSHSTQVAWMWATTFLIFVLPVTVGVGSVLLTLCCWRPRRRDAPDSP